ncbi:hypothetical protein Btru_061037 [Bulinus truncatus]|nr:hypothetical protein Btru_061037 [Bulinus truncatus]
MNGKTDDWGLGEDWKVIWRGWESELSGLFNGTLSVLMAAGEWIRAGVCINELKGRNDSVVYKKIFDRKLMMTTGLYFVLAVMMAVAHGTCPTCTNVQTPSCSDYSTYITCLEGVTLANSCRQTEVDAASSEKATAQTEMTSTCPAQGNCRACTIGQKPTCSDYSTYITCLEGVTLANSCHQTEVDAAASEKATALTEMTSTCPGNCPTCTIGQTPTCRGRKPHDLSNYSAGSPPFSTSILSGNHRDS